MENTQRSLNETSFLDSYSWHHFILFLEEIDEELTIILIASLWFQYTSFEIKIKSILCACFFSVLEFFFYGMTEWGPNDEVLFTPGKFSLDRCHTTWYIYLFSKV